MTDLYDSPETEARLVDLRRIGWGRRLDSWQDLCWFNAPGTRDKRQAVSTYVALGLAPILINYPMPGDLCSCGKIGGCGKSAGKHPVDNGWQNQPIDAARLDDQLARDPHLNLGLRMGPQPNGWFLVAIDIDGPMSLLSQLEGKLGALPPTLTARTGSGGFHLVFRAPTALGNRAAILKTEEGQIDLRGDRGQIVVSPSRHRCGGYYEWIRILEPAELPS